MPVVKVREITNIDDIVIQIGEKKYVYAPFAEWLIFILLLLCVAMTWAFANERDMRLRHEKIILDCINEKPFLFEADRQIGILCARDQKSLQEKP